MLKGLYLKIMHPKNHWLIINPCPIKSKNRFNIVKASCKIMLIYPEPFVSFVVFFPVALMPFPVHIDPKQVMKDYPTDRGDGEGMIFWAVSSFHPWAQPTTHLVGGLEHFVIFHLLGIIIPIDSHIVQRGRYTNNQVWFLWTTKGWPNDQMGPLNIINIH